MTTICNNPNHLKSNTKEEIEEIISKKNRIIQEHRNNPDIPNILLNQNHKKNKLFLIVSGIATLSPEEQEREILNLFASLEVTHFCHCEIDSKFPNEYLYCFKKAIYLGDKEEKYRDIINEAGVSTTSELLLKFKIKEYPDCILFTMSYHFPTVGKVDWTYLFRE